MKDIKEDKWKSNPFAKKYAKTLALRRQHGRLEKQARDAK